MLVSTKKEVWTVHVWGVLGFMPVCWEFRGFCVPEYWTFGFFVRVSQGMLLDVQMVLV